MRISDCSSDVCSSDLSFEPSAQDQLAVSRAELVLENGGGYDGYIDALIEASGTDAHVLTAAEYSHDWPENGGHEAESGDDHAGDDHAEDDHAEDDPDHEHREGFHDHVWYDPHPMVHFAEAVSEDSRQRVVSGKSVAGRVHRCGRCLLKK